MSSSYDDFTNDYWESFQDYAPPILNSVRGELINLVECLEQPFFQEDMPLPPPSSSYGKVATKLRQLLHVIKDVIDETEIDATQHMQNYLQQPLHQGGNSVHQQIGQQPSAAPAQWQEFNGGQQTPYCTLCGCQDSPHFTHHCHLFPTPLEKRDQLTQLERCPDCTRDWHTHWQCPSYLSCTFHPDERHYTWLCPGHSATGPL